MNKGGCVSTYHTATHTLLLVLNQKLKGSG
ncbi:hypothetical protein M2137_000886 [Parabacteroides sp. PFB2-10]|nr:hypothetical protein [Parabacteroides sp. PFB2-10]